MKRILYVFTMLFTTLVFPLLYAVSGSLFHINATGTPITMNLTICLNGKAPISCQTQHIIAANLRISSTIPNHIYDSAGIKLDRPGYVLTGCTPIANGYCLFTLPPKTSANIVISTLKYEFITIGDPGNTADPATGFGTVNYVYRIGKYDVTIQQYAHFLNSVAKTDTYTLYDSNMGSDLNSAGISRSGSPGDYVYHVMNNGGNSANRPITYVSWFNAARFTNWMANGQPQGAQNDATTEDGAYPLHGATTGAAVIKNTINPNTQAPPSFYLPLENEWYKAAFYDGAGGYYTFATQHNEAPGNTIGTEPNQANYFRANGTGFSVTQSLFFAYGVQNYLTDVGAFSGSPSFYGTFDQNGNVDQWNDLDGGASLFRGLRGGFYFAGSSPLQSNLFAKAITTTAYTGSGFRLASPA